LRSRRYFSAALTPGGGAEGFPADALGRRLTIIASGFIFIVGVIVSSYLAYTLAALIVGRLIIGFALGGTRP